MKLPRAKVDFTEDFGPLQRVAQQLEQAEKRSDHARQTFIATRSEQHRSEWAEALRDEREAWTRYWNAHQEYFTGNL